MVRELWPSETLRRARRLVLAGLLASAALAAPLALPAPAQSFYGESPELAARAARGELPPVAQRLPRTPMLIQPEEQIGRYGGTWGLAMMGKSDGILLYRTMGYEHLVRWDPSWRRVVPNVAQSYEVSADATVYTFRLRSGMRWSDGAPFTAEDIRFWFEDVLLNPDLTDERPRWLPRDQGGVRLEVVDPFTVRFVFARPNSLVLGAMAAGQDMGGPTDFPRHALERYHKRYNPEGIDAEVRAAGVKSWVELFRLKSRAYFGRSDAAALLRRPPGDPSAAQEAERIPTLEAWVVTRREPGDPPRYVAERNPYYWKVDPAGKQLPYIDRLEILDAPSDTRLLELLMERRLGVQLRHTGTPGVQDQLPAVFRNGYRPVTMMPADNNVLPLVFNQTHRDPAQRRVLANRDLRVALSIAIDRRAIIDKVFNGQVEPYQAAPRPESRYFSARLARQHLDHDPAAANAILDRLGFTARDAEGYRLDSGGRRLSLHVLTRRDRTFQGAAMALIAADWRAVGVEARLEAVDRSVLRAAMAENRFDVVPGTADGGMDAVLDMHAYVPIAAESLFAPAWQRWYDNPAAPDAEEPPDTVKRQLDLYRRIREAPDSDQQAKLVAEVLEIAADAFVTIGIASHPSRQAVAREDFRNVPRLLVDSWLYPTPAPTNPAQYYIAAP